jgi:solute carrier family 25 (mitochondrial folate transporter), member 32
MVNDDTLCASFSISLFFAHTYGMYSPDSVATTVTYPLQVIKARIQQRSESIELTDDGRIRAVKRNYADIVSTVRRIYQKEGLSGFMKGCFANAFRVAPAAAVTFLVYEEVSDLLGR